MTAPLQKISAIQARIRSLATRKTISVGGLLLTGLSLIVSSLIFLPDAFIASGSASEFNSGLLSCLVGVVAMLLFVGVAFYAYQPVLSFSQIEQRIDSAVGEVKAIVAEHKLDASVVADFRKEAGRALHQAAEKGSDHAVQTHVARKYAIPARS
ncbi:MAG: hypothetical protein JWL59_2028 [Chthoniobacteraceae bacterium]|nr:hypothetical protein [Chthoniobacteraceae bacterium]